MKIKIYGKEREKLKSLIKKKYPTFTILPKKNKIKPNIVICYGGDGTLLLAEREVPNIPKAVIRNSQICNICRDESRDTILELLSENKYYISKHYKIEASCSNGKVEALNDIIIGHYHINTALRFQVFIDDMPYGCEFLGDGVVAATPIGSTAYYQSITRSNFQDGIGLAFNNTVNSIGHIVVDDKNKIRVRITRGPGRLRFDNDKGSITLKKDDEVLIKKSKQTANFVDFYGEHKNLNIDISKNRLPLGYCQVCRKYYQDQNLCNI